MNSLIKIFGFGSYFRLQQCYNDIDLILIHESTSKESCIFATDCKTDIIKSIQRSEIVILSIVEENSIDFLNKASAIPLGVVSVNNYKKELNQVLDKIINFQFCRKKLHSGLKSC